MCTVYGAECIGYINAAFACQVSQCLCKGRIILGLTVVIAQVLEQQQLTRLQCSGLCLGIVTHDILCKNDFLAQQLAQARCDRSHGKLRLPLALRLAHMRAGDDSCAVLQQILDGRQGCADALVIGDDTAAVLCHRDVEVAAKQNLFSLHVNILDALFIVLHF